MVEDELITMKVFYSYANKDQALRDELEKHLGNLMRQDILTSWSNCNINAGEEWKKVINANLEGADIILLLISSDFISSNYCYSVELEKALAKQRAHEADVLPILLRHVDWKGSLFSHLPVLPSNAKPVNAWSDPDEAFVEVVNGIAQVAKKRAGQKYVQRANELLSKQEPEKALISCEQAIQIDPTASAAFFLKGDILFDCLKRYGESLMAFRQGSTLEPTNISYLIKTGDILTDKSYKIKIDDKLLDSYDRDREACSVYQQARDLEPENVSYLIKIGDLHLKHYRGEEALSVYLRASKLDPDNAAYHTKIGTALTQEKRFEEALVAYRRASELEPTDASYFATIGDFHILHTDNFKEVFDAYQRASELESTNISYIERMGFALQGLGKFEEAIAVYRRASNLEPASAWYHDKMGDIFFKKLHRYEEALAAYQRAFELEPTKEMYLTEITDVLLNHLKRPEEAIKAYLKATEFNDSDKAIFYEKIGDIYFGILKHHHKAIEAYLKATELNGTNKAACYEKIGDIHLDYFKDYEEAFAAYRKATEHGRTVAEYYEKQAKALEQWAKRLRNEADSWGFKQ
jgi:tetratricopeptide (TPR) repeat protein